MKLLNEFMAEKYIKKYGCSIAYTRPSVVFGYGRQNTAINWAEDFAAKPALGEIANLPFSKDNVDNWIYVEDCAEQLIRLALKDKLNFSCFNTGSETINGHKLEATVKKFIPNADINFLQEKIHTPLINLTKAEIIIEGSKLNVNYAITHSCYDPSADGLSCGACDACILRKEGFKAAGVMDPTRYI